jgi:hypothetical protein
VPWSSCCRTAKQQRLQQLAQSDEVTAFLQHAVTY